MLDVLVSAHAIALILALIVVEAVALTAYHRITRRGLTAAELLPGLCAGFFLMLALYAALSSAGAAAIAAALFASLLAHAADLRLRWRR